MKVIVFDPISSGKSHFNFNLTIIKIIAESENISSVDVLLSKSQSDELNQSESLDNIKIKKVHGINDSNNNKSVFHFLIYSLIIYFSLFINILNKKPKSLYVLASDNLLSPIFLFLITFFTKIKVYVFLHNNLESIENSNLKKKLLLTNLNKGLIGICLSNFVLQKAKQLLDNNINLLCFPHPSYSYLLMKNLVKRNHFENDFLLLGRHSVYFTENNFHMNLFSTINDLVKKDQIVILLRKNSNSNYKGQNFIVSEYDYPLSDDDYWSLLLNSKFLIIPPQAANRLTASGVHIDAISAGVPVIAPDSGTFPENVGELGQLFLYNERNYCQIFQRALQVQKNYYDNLIIEIENFSDLTSLHKSVSKFDEIFF